MKASPVKERSPNNSVSAHSTVNVYDSSDDENDLLPSDVIVNERQSLLLGIENERVPRYMTASPLPSARINDNSPKDKWGKFRVRSKYYLPILQWLPLYDTHLFWGDLIAGITLSCLLIPQGLSYATALCKLEAVHGLYAIAFPAITYAIFGMSRQMSVGPEATLSLLIGSSIASLQHVGGDSNDAVDPLAWACLMTIFVGVFTFLLGIFRLGFLDSLMSRALLRGFISGVGLVVALQQGIILLGLVKLSEEKGVTEASSSIARFLFLLRNIQFAHGLTTYVSTVSVLFLILARVTKKKLSQYKWVQLIPEVLVVVIVSSVLTYVLDWENQGLSILGTIEGKGIPLPSIPAFPASKNMKDLLVTAAMISVIGFVESVVIAKTYSSKHNYSVSANRELVALGAANMISGLFQGIPAFGSVARSKINDKAGARTQMACLIAGVISLLAIFFLLPYFYYLPKCVLSAIIFIAVLSLLGELPEDLHFIFKIGAWRDLSLLSITFFATIIISLEFGTLLAVTLSLLLTIKETSYPRISIMGRVKGTHNKFKPIQDDPDVVEHLEDVLIVRIDEPLFFANTGQLKDRLRRLEQFGDMSIHPSESPRLGKLSYMIFDVDNMPEIDASAVQILYEIVEAYYARHVKVFFVRLRSQPTALFRKSGLYDVVGEQNFFRKVHDAIEVIEKDMMSQQHSQGIGHGH
ncbi:sulfate transporter family-domain-containing protein [Mycotypha africana]|uniref:sulfate transporter family-domain-containing protein n=1 Tax=Mycotypha africana TaxID=64632 RepID=UPI002301CBCF|nr:sulfate transporter family-domain-containing protein [Mycotypha africana]KAI8984121.1 sulfate transporter family-domain-containing protein [Mycotypha africana]